jgi:hypothetical protein
MPYSTVLSPTTSVHQTKLAEVGSACGFCT